MIELLILIILCIVFWEYILNAIILVAAAIFGLVGITINTAKKLKPAPLSEAQLEERKLKRKKFFKSIVKLVLIATAFILLLALQVII